MIVPGEYHGASVHTVIHSYTWPLTPTWNGIKLKSSASVTRLIFQVLIARATQGRGCGYFMRQHWRFWRRTLVWIQSLGKMEAGSMRVEIPKEKLKLLSGGILARLHVRSHPDPIYRIKTCLQRWLQGWNSGFVSVTRCDGFCLWEEGNYSMVSIAKKQAKS